MTEADWLSSTDPQAMLTFLRGSGRLSDRKARLFAVACCRRIWLLMKDERSRRAVEVAEQYADGQVAAGELEQASRGDWAAAKLIGWIFSKASPDPEAVNAEAAALFASMNPLSPQEAANVVRAASQAEQGNSSRSLCDLLRDIFGPLPLWLVTFPPSVRAWNEGCIPKLAAAAYEERAMPEGTLDPQRLAVLADALEEAGCNDPEILGHLRQPALVHVRGCHVLDLLLNKG